VIPGTQGSGLSSAVFVGNCVAAAAVEAVRVAKPEIAV
jgi:hypothetical protein